MQIPMSKSYSQVAKHLYTRSDKIERNQFGDKNLIANTQETLGTILYHYLDSYV